MDGGAIIPPVTGSGCHGGKDTLEAAARAAGKGAAMDRLMQDYPRGPHDQPQSMCPAFGALRVGLRMRRTATILSGSACCVYGLTFTSHFYGARRSVGYVPFNSETLVKGQLYEDIRDAVYETAKPADYDAVVVINLCVPTASGVPLDRLPKVIDGVRIIGIDVPGFGVPTHAEAKDVLAGAMLRYARTEAEHGPVARPRQQAALPTVAMIGEFFPGDPPGLSALLAPMGLTVAPPLPSREWRDLYAALDCQVAAAAHPFYTATVREFRAAGRPVVGSAPVGVDGTAAWLDAIGAAANVPADKIDAAKARALPAIRAALEANPIRARITVSGYEGSELLVARLLTEAGAEVPYVGTACPRTEWSDADREWLQARGTHIQYRASLEQDLAAMRDVRPDLAVGTTPLVQAAKELGIPALYFTNMVSARPLFGAAGAGSMAAIVAAQIGGAGRFNRMVEFFDGVGTGTAAGYGSLGKPVEPAGARDRYRRAREAKAKATEAMGS
jgi:chlorophyllide a reductase subunit Y